MSQKYIKRIKKGKGRKLKEINKNIKKIIYDVNGFGFYVKSVIKIACNLMIIEDLKNKVKKENEKENE